MLPLDLADHSREFAQSVTVRFNRTFRLVPPAADAVFRTNLAPGVPTAGPASLRLSLWSDGIWNLDACWASEQKKTPAVP